MCDHHPSGPSRPLGRREVLVGGGLISGMVIAGALAVPRASALPPPHPIQVAPDLFIRPRATWGADLPPKGPIAAETPQFLLVHHTASPNTYPRGGARDVIRATYHWHTSTEKGWPDVCYQFFVDHDGVVWEGRSGALDGPVRADATGGSQGFAQLVCLIGDFSVGVDPSGEMLTSLVKVLAWLAERDGIDTSPGAITQFVSRGSQRWRAGTSVTSPTIAGHRDMSYTACPGDRVYGRLAEIRERTHAQRIAFRTALYRAERLGPDG